MHLSKCTANVNDRLERTSLNCNHLFMTYLSRVLCHVYSDSCIYTCQTVDKLGVACGSETQIGYFNKNIRFQTV